MGVNRRRSIAIRILVPACLFSLVFFHFFRTQNAFSDMHLNRQLGVDREECLIILVDFPDIRHNITQGFACTRFAGRLNPYLKQVSYKKFSMDFHVTGKWYTLPHGINQYKISSRNLEVDKSRVRKLIDDAINAADSDVDFSQYSLSAIFLGASRQEYGMVGLCGYPGMLGWNNKTVIKTKSGQIIQGGVAIFTYQAHVGTLFHDIAHIIAGIKDGRRMAPCLYDHDIQAKPGPLRASAVEAMVNMGFWDPMSCHFYKRNKPPPGISSWTRMRLNWLDLKKVKIIQPGQTVECVLGPLELVNSEILAVKIPLSPTRYYLIENRQRFGCDRVLPGSGVLIMQADDGVSECRHGKSPVKLINADPFEPDLEGAAFEIGGIDCFQDKQHHLEIRLLEKIGYSYRIRVSPL